MTTPLTWYLLAPARAAHDAAWAFALWPISHRRPPTGAWPTRVAKRFAVKTAIAGTVFWTSLRTRVAGRVRIPRHAGEGFFSNFLQVLEVLERVRPDARVYVDWTLSGDEGHFRYGESGANIWERLFAPVGPPLDGPAWVPREMQCVTLWGHARQRLNATELQRQRDRYHEIFSRFVSVVSPRVLAEIEGVTRRMEGRFVVGVHRRVGNWMVAALQKSGVAPGLEAMMDLVEAQAARRGAGDYVVYLATDDADAVTGFRARFGDKLIVRDGVKRTTATSPETHDKSSGDLALTDAEDVLIDALLLARAHVLVHATSSVSTTVSFINPQLVLSPVG